MDIISLKAAKAAGLKHYFTGKPCKRGHIDRRLVSTRICMHCNREAVLAWSKGFQARETIRTRERKRRLVAREAGRKHYFTGKPCCKGHITKRSVASLGCMQCIRERAKAKFQSLDGDKREARREYERKRWQDPEFRRKQKEYASRPDECRKKSQRNRAWKKANRASCTDRQNKRNATLYAVYVEDVTLEFLFERDQGRCQLCGHELSLTTKWPDARTPTRDHVVPLTKGGTHERSNLQLACAVCNVRKGNRWNAIDPI